MKYKYFFFDFDGMLANSYPHTATAFQVALETIRNTKISYKEAYDYLKISFDDAYKHFKVTEEEHLLFTKLHTNIDFKPEIFLYLPIIKILQSIIKSGGQNFIYTNRGNETLIPLLKRLGIFDYFTDIIASANKPEPQILLDMIEKYHLPKNECVVVGDRSLDVDGAYNAGVDGILYDVDARVFIHHATYIIRHLNELYNFIDIDFLHHNYHTHTIRCGHASGSDEEYVISAIKNGYQTIGFSDHLMIPNLQRNYEYFESMALLKEKYKEEIDIKIALEVEDYEYYYPFYKQLIEEKHVDYLVFGNHGTMDMNGKSRLQEYSYLRSELKGNEKFLDMYYNSLVRAINSGCFKYIAHPDVYMRGYQIWDDKAIALAHKIAKLLQDNNLYAEVNAQGFRSTSFMEYNNERIHTYPFYEFFKILKQYNIKFVVGADAHSPEALADKALNQAFKLARELDLDLVDKIEDF